MVRVHYLQHVPGEGPGSVQAWARERGVPLGATLLAVGDTLPGLDAFDWLVVLGGPMNVDEEDVYPWLAEEKRFIAEAIGAGRGVLGFCLGAQLIAAALGAQVTRNPETEIGWFDIQPAGDWIRPPLDRLLPGPVAGFHWHGDRFELPVGARLFARSEACDHQGFVWGEHVYAFQFHAEVTPELAARFIEAEGELPPGDYVQSPAAMFAQPGRFGELQRRLFQFLDALAAGTPFPSGTHQDDKG